MTIPEMMNQSGLLTVLGMGVVFAFLIILIFCMKLVEIFVKKTGLDKEGKDASTTVTVNSAGQDKAVIAAIAAAVNKKQQ